MKSGFVLLKKKNESVAFSNQSTIGKRLLPEPSFGQQ
jgi:hypothetical protein